MVCREDVRPPRMAMLGWLVLVMAMVSPAASEGTCQSAGLVEPTAQWTDGMSGNFMLTFPQAVSSWSLQVTFSGALTDFETWAGTPTTSDDTVFMVKSNSDSGNQPAGGKLTVSFLARWTSAADVTSMVLDGAELCPGGPTPSPTLPPHTGTTHHPPTSPTKPPPPLPYDYQSALGMSTLFYEAQRSGHLPSDQRVHWRGDSAMNDKGNSGQDLTGGYYDAGDHVKFGFPMAAAATMLAWGAIDFADGYSGAGETEHVKQSVKWAADFFIKAHTGDTEFYGQCANGEADHSVWGRAEDMTMDRPCYKIDAGAPGSDLAGETAAALAATSMLFADDDASFASSCLSHAKQLFDFADQHRGKYSDSISDAVSFYGSSGFGDELAWAAAWLYRATQDSSYLDKAKGFISEFKLDGRPQEFSWDDKTAGIQLLMWQLTNDNQYSTQVSTFCDWLVNEAPRSPKGMLYLNQWGSLRHVGNVAFILIGAAKNGINADTYKDFAIQQMNYILGSSGRSYVVGFGNNPPVRAHHAGASCPDPPAPCGWDQLNTDAPNPQVLYGALVGGPDQNDQYVDDRKDYVKNEVACDYNAGFQGALAGVLSFY